MGLNAAKGNMYGFVTHTWNTVKGDCYHDCSYCYMKRWGKLNPARFDENELKTDLGENNFIFVGSSCDMFNKEIHEEWISNTINHCKRYTSNNYLFQSKNPSRFTGRAIIAEWCATIESNRYYPTIMGNSPIPERRIFSWLDQVTIEPIMQFDFKPFFNVLMACDPAQINIGADSGRKNLPEPTKKEVIELIEAIKDAGIKVHLKPNLKRITGPVHNLNTEKKNKT